jgi:hypothetical protein
MHHGRLIYPEGTPYDLNNILELPMLPADLIELYVSAETKKKPKFREQIRRQFLLGHLAAEVERSETGGAGQKLTQIQRLLDEKFYEDSENTNIVSYGIFNSDTNALIGKVLKDRPEEIPKNTHIKILEANARRIAGSKEFAFTKIGKKDTADGVRKAIKKANQYKEERQSDQIRPEDDVKDTHRMMVVVYGDSDSADRLVGSVFDLIADQANEEYFINKTIQGVTVTNDDGTPSGLPTDVKIADEAKSSEPGKSEKYARRRIKITFDGMPNPLEIIVQTLEEHVSSELEIGEYDPIAGKYKGPAHPTMSVIREKAINKILFDPSVFTDLPSPDDDPEIPFTRLEEIAKGLAETRHVLLGGKKTSF